MAESMAEPSRQCVLVFAGLDPSGGAGICADIEAIGLSGAHALPIITALTVQDNDKVFAVNPVDAGIIRYQAEVLSQKIKIAAIKIGIVGNHDNALTIADIILQLRQRQPDLPVVLDTVLGSGHGFALADGMPEYAISPLIELATVITPNLPEAARLYPKGKNIQEQAQYLLSKGSKHVLIKGGHGLDESKVTNCWFSDSVFKQWECSRMNDEFHGTGCTLASAIAGYLAQGYSMEDALLIGQELCQMTLTRSYAIAEGQRIPNRHVIWTRLNNDTVVYS